MEAARLIAYKTSGGHPRQIFASAEHDSLIPGIREFGGQTGQRYMTHLLPNGDHIVRVYIHGGSQFGWSGWRTLGAVTQIFNIERFTR